MIEINLSERDFDYEIQALVNSFFPGQRSAVVICGEERSEYEFADDILLTVNISLSMKQISVEVICGDYYLKKTEGSGNQPESVRYGSHRPRRF